MAETKKKILVISDYYLPGFRAGGGLRTVVNMVDRLSERYDFWVITRDHDSRQDKTPYKTVNINEWNAVGQAKVFYFSRYNLRLSTIRRLVSEVQPDAIYMNSIFATPANFFMFLRWRGLLKFPAVLAPCGEVIPAALQFKRRKKSLYFFASKLMGLHKGLFWKATTDLEKKDIENILGKKEMMYVAADVPQRRIFPEYEQSMKPHKVEGELKLVFLARFVKTKNFGFLLDPLSKISGKISIDIVGDLEDQAYWKECLEKIKLLPPNVTINYEGAIDNRLIPKKLAEYHFMILPTRNENFGHVFIEGMSSGCPLIISNRTPWQGLEEKGVGWDLPLEEPQRWVETIQRCISMDNDEYQKMSARAREYAVEWLADESLEQDTITVLEAAINSK